MKNQAVEKIGLIPRSIIRTLDRFKQQFFPNTKSVALQEFRISREQMRTSLKCLITLILIPLLVNFLGKNLFFKPFAEYIWNSQQNDFFLNSYQENRAFIEMQNFEEKFFFESILFTQEKKIKNCDNSNLEFCEFVTNVNILSQEEICPKNFTSNTPPSVIKPEQSLMIIDKEKVLEFDKNPNSCIINDAFINNGKFSKRSKFLVDKNNSPNIQNTIKQPISRPENSYSIVSSFDTQMSENNLGNQIETEMNKNQLPFYSLNTDKVDTNLLLNNTELEFKKKTIELITFYNKQSINAISDFLGDLLTLFTIRFLFIWLRPQIVILKSFLTESLYSLSDGTKSLLIILLTDLLVGYHSPKGWELFTELLLRHYGFPENRIFILFFIGTFPVMLDTIFKYWIFRHLNRISPSTVVTYHSMIE